MENTIILKEKQREEGEREGEIEAKTTLKLPVKLLNEYRHLAIDKGATMTELVIEALKQYLKSEKAKK